ncbi:unnamed protein product [Hermetia illucens]|uniref:Uncharacterized protein n=1 Tax=Hermetia illucens TaxID=343691 RepID=A0A7R8YMI7_HERIL|nr:unnamed protein product [Hermetia illucens]
MAAETKYCFKQEKIPEHETIQVEKLDQFLTDVKKAAVDLAWIRAAAGVNLVYDEKNDRIKRSTNNLKNIFASFNTVSFYSEEGDPSSELSDDNESGDAWYNSFRSKEGKHGNCRNAKLHSTKSKKKNKKKKKKKKFVSKKTQKESNESGDKDRLSERIGHLKMPVSRDFDSVKKVDSPVEISNGGQEFNEQDYDTNTMHQKYDSTSFNKNPNIHKLSFQPDLRNMYQTLNTRQSAYHSPLLRNLPYSFEGNKMVEVKPETRRVSNEDNEADQIELKDQLEQTKNDLSHEADYKLSKVEQDAMGKRSNISWPLLHPEREMTLLMQNYQQRTGQSSEVRTDSKEDEEPRQERSAEAMNEIKLKVSDRLISRGLGASLPSDSLIPRKIITVDDVVAEGHKDEAAYSKRDVWKRSLDAHPLGSEDYYTTGRRILQVNEKDLEDRGDTESTGIEKQRGVNIKGKEIGLVAEKRNTQIPHSKRIRRDAPPLESNVWFEKAKSQYLNTLTPMNLEDQFRIDKSIKNSSFNTVLDEKTDNSTKVPVPANETENIKIKVGFTINATVQGNCSKNLAMGLKQPKTIIVSANDANGKVLEKRGIIFPHIPVTAKKRTNEDVSKGEQYCNAIFLFFSINFSNGPKHNRESLMKTYKDSPLDDLITGKLPCQVINAVFMFAKNNAIFHNQIWPALKNRKGTTAAELRDFSIIRNEDNAIQIQHSEQMLREVMETINTIIEQQVRSRTCVPLRPDLQAFYEQIMASHVENERNGRTSRKRKSHEHHAFGNHLFKRDAISEPKIREKSNVVKKLLNEYDFLSVDDQEKAKEVKDLLEMHQIYLKELELDEKRKKRQKRRIDARKDDSGDTVGKKYAELIRVERCPAKGRMHKGEADEDDAFQEYA